ncbi:MAG: HlyD family efflux transporter periplasmic adaptor subunit [Lachnospiraceae bacterium]|nr:HlyD family efflux transporter periplasmic adaptor subunit [Lachnospiraceae bacterium]
MKAKGKKKGKKVLIIIVIIIVIIIGVSAFSCAMMPDMGVIVTTTKASRGELQESISTSGTISSEERSVVFAPVGGKIGEVKVSVGEAVKAGDLLISYDMKEAQELFEQATLQQTKNTASYDGAMADHAKSQAKLQEADTNLAVLEQQLTDYNNYLETLQDKLTNEQRDTSRQLSDEGYNLSNRSSELEMQFENLDKTAPDYTEKLQKLQSEMQSVSTEMARNQYLQQVASSSDYIIEMEEEIAEIQERIAECEEYKLEMESQKKSSEATIIDTYGMQQYSADKELADMSFKAAEEDYYLAKTGIVAEFDGIITECTAVEGSGITGGMQLLTIENSKQLKVTFHATKYDIEKLQVGQQVEVTILDKEYRGKVSKINRMAAATAANNSPMIGVEVHIENPDDNIILGLDAKLKIHTAKAENALMIPVEVINADKEGDFLYVVEEGVVVKKPIVCGISTDTHTEVLEGITEADEIVVMALTGGIEEGMVVTVMPEEEAIYGAGMGIY